MVTGDLIKHVYLASGQAPATVEDNTIYFNPVTKKISVGNVEFSAANIVSVTYDSEKDSYSSDVTFNAIVADVTAGHLVSVIFDNQIYLLNKVASDNTSLEFLCDSSRDLSTGVHTYKKLTFTSAGIAYSDASLNTLPVVTAADAGKVLQVDASGNWALAALTNN